MDPIPQQEPPSDQPSPVLPTSPSWGRMILISLGVLGLGMAIAFGGFFLGQQNSKQKGSVSGTSHSSTVTVSPTPVPQSYEENTAIAGQKRYVSKLGISFLYMPSSDNNQVAVKEVGNKIYVYPTTNSYDKGQYVEVFSKDPHASLDQTLQKQFLQGSSTKDCFVDDKKLREYDFYPPSYILRSINAPQSTDPGEPVWAPALACPQPYTESNGMAYFLMDTKHPNLFLFLNIGQYGINADAIHMWQDTIQFTN